MTVWRDKLFIYEINTRVWLTTLSQRYGRTITLANVPDEDLQALALPNVDALWLMGVWTRSERARRHSLRYRHEYIDVLPNLRDEDVIGSAYSIAAYEVDPKIGGREGLAKLRRRLRKRGLRLILDYVPNHVAIDHPWVENHPEFIVKGRLRDARLRPSDFFQHEDSQGKPVVLAHGRDPYFPGWSDTAQLNAFHPGLRAAARETLLDIASQCDGVRCDMAMLVMNDVFKNTWADYVGEPPAEDYWPPLIAAVRQKYPHFLFVAEVYWGKEQAMIDQGFDYAYDKTLYDRILGYDVQALRQHLVAPIEFQRHLLRFIENHDEARAWATLGPEKSFPAATLICTLPGACLLHQGQLEGCRLRIPVHICRGPTETTQPELTAHYHRLLEETRNPIYQRGEWYLFELRPAGPGDISHYNLLAYGWREKGRNYRLIVVNLTPIHSYARLPLNHWSEIAGRAWRLDDVANGTSYERDGDEMLANGLYIELRPFESHVFRFEAIEALHVTGQQARQRH